MIGVFRGTATFDGHSITNTAGGDIGIMFIAKYGRNGEVLWANRAGDQLGTFAYGEATVVAGSGDCYVGGGISQDIFVARYAASGQVVWMRKDGGSKQAFVRSVGVDGEGNYFLVGGFSSVSNIGGQTLEARSWHDGFVVKYDSSGTPRWVRQIGGAGADEVTRISVQPDGCCYLAGNVWGEASFLTTNLVARAYDVFLAKLNAEGPLEWVQTMGSTGEDFAAGVAADAAGNVYVTGNCAGPASFGDTTLGPNAYGVFLAKYSPSGQLRWCQLGDGPSYDFGGGIAVARDGASWITGKFQDRATFGVQKLTSAGGEDIFVAKRASRGPPGFISQPSDTSVLLGQPAELAATVDTASPVGLQWFRGGDPLPGGTNATLRLPSVGRADAGAYRLVVTNPDGVSTSTVATLSLRFPLSVSVAGQGTVAVEPQQADYLEGTLVTLRATSQAGFGFIGWGGDAQGKQNPLVLTMDDSKKVSATFVPLTLTTAVEGEGAVVKLPDQPVYELGQLVQVTAIPGRWHRFTGWSDALVLNPREVAIGDIDYLKAFFAPTTALERVEFNGVSRLAPVGTPAPFVNGLFTAAESVSVRGLATIRLTTTFADGTILYTLDGSDPALNGRIYAGEMTTDASSTLRAIAYTRDFLAWAPSDPVVITLLPTVTVQCSGGGTVTVAPPEGAYFEGARADLTAVAAPGWEFLQWIGDAVGDTPSVSLVMAENQCATAMFGTALTANVVGNGAVVLEPATALLPHGTRVRLTAVPGAGSHFAFWATAISGTVNPASLSVTEAEPVVTAVFSALSAGHFAITAVPRGFGKVVLEPSTNVFRSGQTVVLRAVPDEDGTFQGWSGDADGNTNVLSVKADQSKVIFADFTQRPRLDLGGCGQGRRRGAFHFKLICPPGAAYRIDVSPDWTTWAALAEGICRYGVEQIRDDGIPANALRFYRAVLPNP